MKKLFYLIVVVLFTFGCDNSSLVDPEVESPAEYGISSELNKIDGLQSDILHSRKVYKNLSYQCNLHFDPNLSDKSCGGFLTLNHPGYQYENKYERTLRNLKVFVPSKLVVDNKVYKTFHLYTINRYEKLESKGNLVNGQTWGDFQIVVAVNPIEEKNIENNKSKMIGYEVSNVKPIYEKFGDIMFAGQFSGEINSRKTKMELVGKGANSFKNSLLIGQENIICSGEFCWKSDGSGTVRKVEYWDE
ncbi:MAG: hypothetical protein KDC88_10110 [Ignavibacteriae bacterium]|nr:hypothetical protein [Ignavibacteriota bacterium]MCB9207340.1 hypothetical protein [Ignavibacteriales bacterium]MCB9211754.1 hypothetical protein [Ignavibacteriales bacterium]